MMNQDHLVFLVGNLGRGVGRNGQLQFWQLNWSTGPKKEHLKKVLKPTGQDPSAKSMKLQVNTVCLVYLSIVVVWWSNIVSSIALYLQTIMSLTTSWTSWTSKTDVACFGRFPSGKKNEGVWGAICDCDASDGMCANVGMANMCS